MYVEVNVVASSCNHYCGRKGTMRSVSVVELNVTVKCIKILNVAQQCFYGKFASPATKGILCNSF